MQSETDIILNERVCVPMQHSLTNINEALYISCKNGDLDCLKSILSQHQNVNLSEYLLTISIIHGHINIVRYLIDNNIINSTKNYDDCIKYACANGHLQIVKYLINFINNNDVINKSFEFACRHGHLDIVIFLISYNANIHYGNNLPLIIASINGHHEIVKLLVLRNANILDQNIGALYGAYNHGHLNIVKYLLDHISDHSIIDDKKLEIIYKQINIHRNKIKNARIPD